MARAGAALGRRGVRRAGAGGHHVPRGRGPARRPVAAARGGRVLHGAVHEQSQCRGAREVRRHCPQPRRGDAGGDGGHGRAAGLAAGGGRAALPRVRRQHPCAAGGRHAPRHGRGLARCDAEHARQPHAEGEYRPRVEHGAVAQLAHRGSARGEGLQHDAARHVAVRAAAARAVLPRRPQAQGCARDWPHAGAAPAAHVRAGGVLPCAPARGRGRGGARGGAAGAASRAARGVRADGGRGEQRPREVAGAADRGAAAGGRRVRPGAVGGGASARRPHRQPGAIGPRHEARHPAVLRAGVRPARGAAGGGGRGLHGGRGGTRRGGGTQAVRPGLRGRRRRA
mmetsp:Transcript_4509/g.15159  ORF Transcript_4509/g.15159 Transcript_4509/m.15159 type:complete len:340 (+) Transcript_4509:456-1475(+)